MDSAYSLEIDEVVDAENAYDLFQAGIIKNKKAFECIGENCIAQATCVNIDREIQETSFQFLFISKAVDTILNFKMSFGTNTFR